MANTTARTRKAVAATKTATANITAARKAVAKKTAAAPVSDKPKKEQTFEERDWTYLDDKPPSEQHDLLAREINRRTNLAVECGECGTENPIDAKQVQAVLAMFPHFQRSETNKNRSGYRPLAEEIVHQRSVHMTQAHKDAREIMDGLAQKATPAAKKTPAKAPAKKAAAKPVPAKAAKKAAAPKLNTATRPATPANPAPKEATPSHTGGLAAPVRKARVTKKAVATPAPAAAEAF